MVNFITQYVMYNQLTRDISSWMKIEVDNNKGTIVATINFPIILKNIEKICKCIDCCYHASVATKKIIGLQGFSVRSKKLLTKRGYICR